LTVFGFLIFIAVFDLLILVAIWHGNSVAPSISQSPVQTKPQPQVIEYDASDFMMPSDLVEQPFINSN
jgi:hypothetical protein